MICGDLMANGHGWLAAKTRTLFRQILNLEQEEGLLHGLTKKISFAYLAVFMTLILTTSMTFGDSMVPISINFLEVEESAPINLEYMAVAVVRNLAAEMIQ